MDVWFETCLWSPPRQGMGIDGFMFHDMLYWHTALLSHPGSSLVYTTNFNPIYPKLTACIIHASLSICLLCLSWLFFFRFRLYVSVYSCISICMSSSLSHFPHLSLSLLAKKAFALYSLAARQLSKQHRYDFLLACAHLLAPLCWKDEGVSLSFLHVMEVWTLASGTLQPLSVCIKVVHTLWVTYAEKIKQTLIIQCSCL